MVPRFIVVVLVLAALGMAQVPAKTNQPGHDVELCDLIRHPKSYEGKMIRVRGHVIFGFENFVLDSSGCGIDLASSHDSRKGVWLTFGGDAPEIATFCCGSNRRTKGSDYEVAGHRVGLVRDAELSVFLHRLQAHRLRRPDGKPCFDECRFYEVTATLTGLFATAGKGGGYGHFGMFHLFVIQEVAQIRAERRPVPFGGTFDCPPETWEPQGEEAALMADSLGCTKSTEEDCTPSVRFRRAAAHWNDDLNGGSATEVYTDMDRALIANWISPDLLTSYMTRSAGDAEVSITAEHCQPITPDRARRPISVTVACDEYEQSVDEALAREVDQLLAKNDFKAAWAKQAAAAKGLFPTGDQSWRLGEAKTAAWHVLQEQAGRWRLMPGADLKFDKCDDSSMDDTPIFMGCTWYSPDGTQAFDVSLLKERRATDKPQSAPWLVTGVRAAVCRPDKD